MIDLLKSIWTSLFGVIRWGIHNLSMIISSGKIISKIYLFLGDFLFLIPGFLAWFCVLYMIIFVVNRFTIGRN